MADQQKEIADLQKEVADQKKRLQVLESWVQAIQIELARGERPWNLIAGVRRT
jgi:uncharacterized protein YeeX (DUF496 family)